MISLMGPTGVSMAAQPAAESFAFERALIVAVFVGVALIGSLLRKRFEW